MQGVDDRIILFFQSIRCDLLTLIFKCFIPLEIWYGVALAVVLFFFYRTGLLRAPVISFVLARNLAAFCYEAAKDLFHRPRPFLTIKGAVPLITPHGFSFPSGHATLAMASAVVLAHHFPKARKFVYTLAILTGLSRVYLGVHYLSDVLGGFVLGAMLGWVAIQLERVVLSLAQGVQLQKKIMMMLVVSVIAFDPSLSQAKAADEQDQVILLNDSAAALEDSNPELSKSLTKFADEKELEWEKDNANKDQAPSPVLVSEIPHLKEQIKILIAAALAIEPTYPLIAKSLDKMAKDMGNKIEGKQ